MKPEDLIKAAEELNEIMPLDPVLDTTLSPDKLAGLVKEAALWLLVTDELEDSTVKTIKDLSWNSSDFKNLKESQDPMPAFIRFGIIEEEHDAEPPKKKAVKKPVKKVRAEVPEEEVEEVVEEKAKEHLDGPPKAAPLGPSAYATALAVMGTNPNMEMHTLYVIMKKKGFDLRISSGTIKTAHSIFRRVFRSLVDNGYASTKPIKK